MGCARIGGWTSGVGWGHPPFAGELPADAAAAVTEVLAAPPVDPEVAAVMRTFAYAAGDPTQAAAIRRRAERMVQQRREMEARNEVEAERTREALRIREQRQLAEAAR